MLNSLLARNNNNNASSEDTMEIHTGVTLSEPLIEQQEKATDGDDDDDHDDDLSFGVWDNLSLFCILPALLYLQFGMAYYGEDPSISHLPWSSVTIAIVLFVVTAFMYRECLQDCFSQSSASRSSCEQRWILALLILVPEIAMDVILAMVLFYNTHAAFVVLSITILSLDIFVIFASLGLLCGWFEDATSEQVFSEECEYLPAVVEEQDESSSSSFDEMDVSQKNGILRFDSTDML